MFGKRLRSLLDLVRPDLAKSVQHRQDQQKQYHDRRARPRQFSVGDHVYARNYGQGPLPGQVLETLGAVPFKVKLESGCCIRRHADQLRSHTCPTVESDDAISDETGCHSQTESTNDSTTAPVDAETTEVNLTTEPPRSSEQLCPQPHNPSSQEASESPYGLDQLRDEAKGPPSQCLRRSSRVRHPPLRYGD